MRRFLSASILLSVGLGACSGPPPEAPLPTPGVNDGHERMLELLRQVHGRSVVENTYLGTRNLERARAKVEALTAASPPAQKIGLYGRLATEELRMGNTDAAIEGFTKMRELADAMPEGVRDKFVGGAAYYLGTAWLRWAENQNCVHHHTSDSCIFPIRDGGVHVDQKGARNAMESFAEVLQRFAPKSVEYEAARWLYNVAAMTVAEYPDGVPPAHLIAPEVFDSDVEFPRFRDVAPELGLNTFDLCGGALAEDFDGDGRLDLVTSTWKTDGQMHFFRNDGDGGFTERTADVGLNGLVGGLNMVQADYDNDGDTDVLVLRGAWLRADSRHPNSLLRNDGGSFTDVTFAAGLGRAHFPTQTADWADYDNDGDLDLYIGNESRGSAEIANQLFRNEGNGTFTDVARQAGVENLRYAKAVSWGDYDDDRYADIYVSNLNGDNRLYRNNGDGTFVDIAPSLGVTSPRFSFPAWFWDYNNDGRLDIYVSTYNENKGPSRLFPVVASYVGLPPRAETSRLYRGTGAGGFEDVTRAVGLRRVTVAMGANFGDLNNDGFHDFYLGTGYPEYDGLVPNVMFLNQAGERFADVTTAGGFGHLQKGHGVVFADFDYDGDQDVFEQMGGAYPGDGFGNAFYRNPGFGNHWVRIKLEGNQSNRSGIGARIRLDVDDSGVRRTLYRTVGEGGSFGGNPTTLHIGIGAATQINRLEVFWPVTGETQRFENLRADELLTIAEGSPDVRYP